MGARIVLMRHGPPVGVPRDAVLAREMAAWVDARDSAPIDSAPPPPDAVAAVAESAMILCSPLHRALASAKRLAGGRDVVVVANGYEVPLTITERGWLRLPPWSWVMLARIGWFRGRTGSGESLVAARERAEAVATVLARHAGEAGTVLFVGHGLLNVLIARALRRRGFAGPRMPARRCWHSARYVRR